MTTLFALRSRIKQFITSKDKYFALAFKIIIFYVAFALINYTFGYQRVLLSKWVPFALAVVCSLLQIGMGVLLVLIYTIFQLSALTTWVAVAALVLVFLCYGACAYFQAKHTYNLAFMPLTSTIRVPFLMPLWSGLFGNINELISVLMGAIVTYFIKSVYTNAYSLAADDSSVLVIITAILSSSMFYVYLMANVIMFLGVYYVRKSRIKYSWFIAVASGVVAEFIIMLIAYSFIDRKSEIPNLLLGNFIILVLGLIITFFMQDANFEGTERVAFEDDEYFYYVTAVPKVRIANEERKVKKITQKKPEPSVARRRELPQSERPERIERPERPQRQVINESEPLNTVNEGKEETFERLPQ